MFTALTLSMALGAPIPAATAPVAAGTAPRLMELKADANGKITVTIVRTEMQKVQVAAGGAIGPNGAPPAVLTREIAVSKQAVVELGEVKDLTITTADGKKLDKDEAIKKLTNGAIVIVSGDGKPVSPVFLKVFKDDTIVLASPELVAAPQGPATGVIKPGIRPLPAQIQPIGPPVQILPVQPGGVIQIQIGPGGVAPAVLPVELPQPVPVEKPVPAKPEK